MNRIHPSSSSHRRPRHLALAALLVGSPVASFAQATSNVTIYGIVDLGVRYTSGLTNTQAPATGSSSGLISGANSTSRFGLRGSEDLGGGNKAIFNMEGGRNFDTGAQISSTQVFDRASYVGLSGTWGTFTLGRQINMVAEAISPVDPMSMRLAALNPNIANTALGSHGLGIEYGSSGSRTASFRVDNALKYSLTRGPYTVRAMYSFNESATDAKNMGSAGVGAAYSSHGVDLTAAYHQFRSANNHKLEATVFGAAYTWGAYRIAGNFGRNEAVLNDLSRTVHTIQGLGATWNVNPTISLTAAVYRLSRTRTAAPKDGFIRGVFFAEYILSRRSQLYAEIDSTTWRGGYQGSGNQSHGRGVTVGLKHSF